MGKFILSPYHHSFKKRFIDIFFSATGIIILSPVLVLLSLLVLIFSGYPVFFVQKRIGLKGKHFNIIKFRTMKKGAEKIRYKYKKLNEADGPVFKIYNDPRFTKIGKLFSRIGLDELPQLFNVFKGDMSLVGPRPLPVYEAKMLSKAQKFREYVKPGITSLWVISGAHNLSFKDWMRLDRVYLEKASLKIDLKIILSTITILIG